MWIRTHAIDKEKISNLTDLAEMDSDAGLNHHDDDHDVTAEHAGHHNALASLLTILMNQRANIIMLCIVAG